MYPIPIPTAFSFQPESCEQKICDQVPPHLRKMLSDSTTEPGFHWPLTQSHICSPPGISFNETERIGSDGSESGLESEEQVKLL